MVMAKRDKGTAPDPRRLTIRGVEKAVEASALEFTKKGLDRAKERAQDIVYPMVLKELADRLETLALDQEEYKLFEQICKYLQDSGKLTGEQKEHVDKINKKRAEEVAAVAAETLRVAQEEAEKKRAAEEEAKEAEAKAAEAAAVKAAAAKAAAEDEDESSEEEDADVQAATVKHVPVVREGKVEIKDIRDKFETNKVSDLKKIYDNELDHAVYYALAQIHEENTGKEIKWNDGQATNKGRESGVGEIRPTGAQRREAYKKLAEELGINFYADRYKKGKLTNTALFRKDVFAKLNSTASSGLVVTGTPGYSAATVSPPAATAITSFKALKTKGDGDCLFHAIAAGLPLTDHKSHEELRQMACDRMQQRVDANEEFYNEGGSRVNKNYVDTMRGAGVYAGSVEIGALYQALGRTIVIITTPNLDGCDQPIDFSSITQVQAFDDVNRMDHAIFIQFNGKKDNSAHYFAVEVPAGMSKHDFYEHLKAAAEANRPTAGSAAAPSAPKVK